MNQMVPNRAQEPANMHDYLVSAYKARQARYAAAAIPQEKPPAKKTPTQLLIEILAAEEAKALARQEIRRKEEEATQLEERKKIERIRQELANVELVRKVKDLDVQNIIKVVADSYHITSIDILSHSQCRGGRKSTDVITPRHVAMYLSKKVTMYSLSNLGRLFNNRDHSTIISAVYKIEKMMEAEPSFRVKVEELRAAVTGQVGG